jgi:hypothetical protein
MFYIILTVYDGLHNIFLVLNLFAVILSTGLAISIFLYNRKVIGLGNRLSFVSTLAFIFSILVLRLTWDQYRMSMGLIFAILALVFLSSTRKKFQYIAVPLSILVCISNFEPVIFFLPTLAIQTFLDVLRKKKSTVDLIPVIAILLVCLPLLVYEFKVSPQYLGPVTGYFPLRFFPSFQSGIIEAVRGLEYLLYTSWPLLIFAFILLMKTKNRRDLFASYHFIWLFLVLFAAIVVPLIGIRIAGLQDPSLWMYWMIPFPLTAIFAQTLKEQTPRAKFIHLLATALVVFMITTSLAYATTPSTNPSPYSKLGTTFQDNTPAGYLQTAVSLRQTMQVYQLLNRSITNLPSNSTIFIAQEFYGLALTLNNPNRINITNIGQVGALGMSAFSKINSTGNGYTIWLTHPNGEYGIYSFPASYIIVYTLGDFSLYQMKSASI